MLPESFRKMKIISFLGKFFVDYRLSVFTMNQQNLIKTVGIYKLLLVLTNFFTNQAID
jgi:hypothetical protein